MFHQKTVWRDSWPGMLSWWSCQSPVAHSFGLLNHPNSFHGGMFQLNTKFDADSLLYSVSHVECNGYTVHMLTQQQLPPPLTSTNGYCVTMAVKMTERVEQWICIKFCVTLEHSSLETIRMIQKATATGNWWLAASSQQCAHSCISSPAAFFDEISNHPGDSTTL